MYRPLKALLNRFYAKDVAATMGVAPSTIHRWRAGKTKPSRSNKTLIKSLWDSQKTKSFKATRKRKQKLKNRKKLPYFQTQEKIKRSSIPAPDKIKKHKGHTTFYFESDCEWGEYIEPFSPLMIETAFAYDALIVGIQWAYLTENGVQYGSTNFTHWPSFPRGTMGGLGMNILDQNIENLTELFNDKIKEGSSGDSINLTSVSIIVNTLRPFRKKLPMKPKDYFSNNELKVWQNKGK